MKVIVQKYVLSAHQIREPKYCQSTIYYAGLLARWDKQIIDQESSKFQVLFLFILFIDLGHTKLFIFIFVI